MNFIKNVRNYNPAKITKYLWSVPCGSFSYSPVVSLPLSLSLSTVRYPISLNNYYKILQRNKVLQRYGDYKILVFNIYQVQIYTWKKHLINHLYPYTQQILVVIEPCNILLLPSSFDCDHKGGRISV